MSKQILFIVFLLFGITSVNSQNTYNFSYTTDFYYEFSDGNLVDMSPICFGGVEEAPIGFDFPFFQYSINILFLTDEYVGSELDISSPSQYITGLMFLFGANNSCHSFYTSELSYKTTGLPGQRIFKYQAKKLGFEYGLSSDYFSYQLWLYEGSGRIELRVGPNQVLSPTDHYYPGYSGPIVGPTLINEFSDQILPGSLLIKNLPSSPIAVTQNLDWDNLPYLNAHPASGMVYIFDNQIVGMEENKTAELNIHLFPNPTSDYIELDLPEMVDASFTILNLEGKTLHEGTSSKIDVSDFENGVYFVKVKTQNGVQELKFVKN